jgi:glycosyltransferase involved in cell wall biosynthesis
MASVREAMSLVRARLWNARAPAREAHLGDVTNKYYLRAHANGHSKPTVVVVSPYAVYPPSHGGSRRIASLLQHLQGGFQLVLLTDEAGLYSAKTLERYPGVSVVHAVGGRPDLEAGANRIARIRSHCHAALRQELARIVDCYSPALVQIEFVELAGLVEERRSGTPWVLTLHDVLLSGNLSSEENQFERKLMKKYDALVACCDEDAALLDGVRVRVIPNGADTGGAYGPPSSGRSLLFAGPFRYRPNLDGISTFLKTVYPKLLERVPGVEIHILGGQGAPATAARLECFHLPGVQVHDHQDDIAPWLERCAVSINPLTGIRGSCIKLAESLAAGRVCVSTIEGARGFLDPSLTSLVKVGSIDDFLGPICDLLLDEALRHRTEKLTETARRSLDWARSAALQTALYEELIRNGRRR